MSETSSRPRVLIVEDEMLVAMLVEDMLIELGCTVAGHSTHLVEAVQLAKRETLDFAILDVNLDGQHSFPVADVLRRRGVPFTFTTGYGVQALENPYDDVPTLQKPFRTEELEHALRRLGLR